MLQVRAGGAWQLRGSEKPLSDGGAPEQSSDEETRSDPQRAILCAACGHRVTYDEERFAMAGRHQHTCINPAGYVYRIGCFRGAPGCVGTGSWSAHYSWFAGFVWQVACCGSCSMHLGWAFEPENPRGGAARFWGLIVDRLVESSRSGPDA